jgi:hypothetical protein
MNTKLRKQIAFAIAVMRRCRAKDLEDTSEYGMEFARGHAAALRFAISLLDETSEEAQQIEAELKQIMERTA